MNVRTGYQLNVDTIETLDDVKIILDKLNLTTYPEGGDWEILQKYFTTEIQTPALTLPTEEELVAANSSFLDVAATSDV
jgi:hypothetical protein